MQASVLIADDHAQVRRALHDLVEREGLEVVAEVADYRQAVEASERFRPDLVVLGLMEPVVTRLDAAREIHRVSPRSRTILLTTRPEKAATLETLRCGVQGCVPRDAAAEELVLAVHEVLKGGIYLSAGAPC